MDFVFVSKMHVDAHLLHKEPLTYAKLVEFT